MANQYRDWNQELLESFHKMLLRQAWAMARRSQSPDFDTAREKEEYLKLVGDLADVNREWDRRLMEAIA